MDRHSYIRLYIYISRNFKLYGEEIYFDRLCTFSGTLSFRYMKSENEYSSLSLRLSLDVLYVSSKPISYFI